METYILLLEDRKLLENIENSVFENISQVIERLYELGMTDEIEDSLGYYPLTEFMDLVNNQILDNLTNTFIGYVQIKEPTLYYVVTKHLDNTDSWNGLRTINVYKETNKGLVLEAELTAKSDDIGNYFYTDEEEIQLWLEEQGDNKMYNIIQL